MLIPTVGTADVPDRSAQADLLAQHFSSALDVESIPYTLCSSIKTD